MMGSDRPMEFKIEGDAEARVAVGACAEAHPSFDPAEVLADLERDGVYGAVLIGRIAVHRHHVPLEADVAYCRAGERLDGGELGPVPGPRRRRASCCRYTRHRGVGQGARALRGDGHAAGAAARRHRATCPYHLAEWEPLWEAPTR